MIQWNKVTVYSQILAIVLGLLIFASGFYLGSLYEKKQESPVVAEISKNTVTQPATPVEKTVPVTFKGLDSSTKALPPLPSDAAWEEKVGNTEIFKDRYLEVVQKYGNLAKRYYFSEDYDYYTIEVTEADLTSDGVPEKIISFDDGGTYGVEKYHIISGDKIIATIDSPSVGRGGGFLPDKSGNGFTFVWYTEDMFPNGYCCPVAKMVTRFVYENGGFKIASEDREEISS